MTKSKKSVKDSSNTAQRDFHLFLPPSLDIRIKEGDDIRELNLPDNLLENLKTEKVLKG